MCLIMRIIKMIQEINVNAWVRKATDPQKSKMSDGRKEGKLRGKKKILLNMRKRR